MISGDSPCAEPKELSPSEGLGIRSLLFQEEEEAIRIVSMPGSKENRGMKSTRKKKGSSGLIERKKLDLGTEDSGKKRERE